MRSMKPAVAKRRRVSRDGAKRRHRARARPYARWRRSNRRRRSDGAAVAGFIASGVTERTTVYGPVADIQKRQKSANFGRFYRAAQLSLYRFSRLCLAESRHSQTADFHPN